jgi:glycosyltransferase involved in cell wall biosynthesis
LDPLVSTVIPAYNSGTTIALAIRSALEQTYPHQEIIVVDDGSSDNTKQVVQGFGGRVAFITQRHGGPAAARNNGIQTARGEYIAFLDADDAWRPEKLDRQLALFLADPGIGAVTCGACYVDNTLRILDVKRCVPGRVALLDVLRFRNLPAFLSGLVVRRSCLDQIGPFDSTVDTREDWDLAIRAARFCNLTTLAEPLVLYRIHPGNRSRDVDGNIAGGLAILGRLFRDPATPRPIVAAKRRIYGAFYLMVAGSYFRTGRLGRCIRWSARSLIADPAQAGYMIAFPARVLRRLAIRSRRTSSG